MVGVNDDRGKKGLAPVGRMMEESQAREFAAAFRSFLSWVHEEAHQGRRNEVAALVMGFLGEERAERSVVARTLPQFEHVNLQTALDAWSQEPGREVVTHGVMVPPHHGETPLEQIVTGEVFGPLRLSPPSLVDLPNGPRSTLACLRRAILLVTDAQGRYAVMITGPHDRDPSLTVEIAGLEVHEAQAVHARLDHLRSELNVYRGQVLDVVATPHGRSRPALQ